MTGTIAIPSDYYGKVSTIESGNNPNAQNPSSSASGLFQFLNKTFTNLGYPLSSKNDPATQMAAMSAVTQSNAQSLVNNGLAVTDENLYTDHFFGPATGASVLQASDATPIASIVGNTVVDSNPSLASMTVGQYKDSIAAKFSSNAVVDGATKLLGILAGGTPATSAPVATQQTTSDANSSTAGDGTLLGYIKSLLSFHTAARASAVVIGILFIALAVAAFVLTSSDTGKALVSKIKVAV